MWWIWVLIAVAAIVAELTMSGLVFGGVAAAAVLAALVSLVLPGPIPGAVTLLAVSVIYLLTLRPVAMRMLGLHTPNRLTGPSSTSSMVGRKALVTQDITPHTGQIRIGGGDFWTARPYDGKESIPAGSTVEIALVEGLTCLVWTEAP
jgi:membrane protein implicated in regulation of membrane protease activity